MPLILQPTFRQIGEICSANHPEICRWMNADKGNEPPAIFILRGDRRAWRIALKMTR
jgi:hypothetical protein